MSLGFSLRGADAAAEVRESRVQRRRRHDDSGRLWQRVLRASLPLQLALMLALMALASLTPVCEDEWHCVLANNLEDSFTPVLRYVRGPPPL